MRFLTYCAAAAALMASSAFAQAPPPVEAFGRLPAVAHAAISPDGSKVALAMSLDDGRPLVVVYDVNAQRRIYSNGIEEETELRSVDWVDDTHLTVLVTKTFHPNQAVPSYVRFYGNPTRIVLSRNIAVNLENERVTRLVTDPLEEWRSGGGGLIAPIEGDPHHAFLTAWSWRGGAGYLAFWRINVENGRVREIGRRQGFTDDTVSFSLDERGEVLARVDSDLETNHWSLHVYQGDAVRTVMEGQSEFGEAVDLEGALPDSRVIILDEDPQNEFLVLYAINPTDGSKEVFFQRPGHDVAGAVTDPWTRRVVGATWIDTESRQQFFEPALQAAYERAAGAFQDGSAALVSWSRDRSRVLVYGEHGLDGGAYYVMTPASGTLERLAFRYPQVATAPHGGRQSITYRARDGVRVPAYLTLPPGEARNLPLVLLVHGGPHSRDDMGFDYWASFLASRGYAVLQPNFRGSIGYGRSWEHAGRRGWGGLMQTDVEDGIPALARAGIIDPARVCIVGGSYGGYAALAGATLTPDRYKCAASIAGVSDLQEWLDRAMARSDGNDESDRVEYWRASIGDREDDRERVRATSPALQAERVRAPILLMHGTDDAVVPMDQSRRMLRALQAAGKDVRFVELRGDDHWLSDAPTRIQMLRELETFLAQHLGPAPAPAN